MQAQRSIQLPSRTASRAWLPTPHRARAGRRPRARPLGRLCDVRSHQSRHRRGPGRPGGLSGQAAPLFGLTFPGMHGMRQSRGRLPGLVLFVLSVSALWASMLFPALAQAEDASGIQYSEAPPTATGGHEKTHHEPSAKSSNSGGGATAPKDSQQTNSSAGSGKGSDAGRSSSNAGNSPQGSGNGQGNPAGGSSGGEGSSPQQTDQQASAASAPHESDSGSSPLVAILIAIAALAAISVAAVMLRAKRQRSDGGTPVSPEAS
jgi:hypothetical protein